MNSIPMLITCAALAALSVSPRLTHALIILDFRTSSYELAGLNSSFSGGRANYGIMVSGSADATESIPATFQTKSESASVAVNGSGAFGSTTFTIL